MTYSELKQKQQDDFGKLPIFFAFNEKQFNEGLAKFGLSESDGRMLYHIGGGGYIKKGDVDRFTEFSKTTSNEMSEAFKDDKFLIGAFKYELANHEYGYTYDIMPTFIALGIKYSLLETDERISKLFNRAKKEYLDSFEG